VLVRQVQAKIGLFHDVACKHVAGRVVQMILQVMCTTGTDPAYVASMIDNQTNTAELGLRLNLSTMGKRKWKLLDKSSLLALWSALVVPTEPHETRANMVQPLLTIKKILHIHSLQ
jgi:hypothetical protein